MEVLPERGLAEAVAGPPVAVGEASGVADDVAGASVGACVPAARSGAGAPTAGAGAAVDCTGAGTAGTAGAGTAGAGCGVPGTGGATGCGAIVWVGDGFGVRLGSGSSGSSEAVG